MTDIAHPNSIAVPAAMLKAALVCASTEQARYYLNGVYVDPKGFLVSTDGHRLFCGAIDVSDVPAFDGWILPYAAIKRALTGFKADLIGISPAHVGDIACQSVDGTFPEWRRVVPTELSGETAQFNPAYVSDMGKIGEILFGRGKPVLPAHIHHNGEGPAGVTFPTCDDAFAVLMPIRSGHTDPCDAWAARSAMAG
jgi:DNA polymerase-3 subunit beta